MESDDGRGVVLLRACTRCNKALEKLPGSDCIGSFAYTFQVTDVFTKAKRSQVMAAIRSRGNKDTELKLAAIFRAAGIKGWRRHQPLPGRPDFVFRRQRVAVFVDGCFWHGCRWHCRMPKSRLWFWTPKIARNRRRDRTVNKMMRQRAWRVIRIWEHSLRDPQKIISLINAALDSSPPNHYKELGWIP